MSYSFGTVALDRENCQLHTPHDLSVRKGTWMITEQKVLQKIENGLTLPGIEPRFLILAHRSCAVK